MKIVASIQARMMSTRLPGKVLMPLGGKPMLLFQIERLKRCRLVGEVIVASSTNPADDAIADLCAKNDIRCFRGSEDDVLERVCQAVTSAAADIHVECFGDSPFVDPELIDEMVATITNTASAIDLVTNCHKSTFPTGMETYIYRAACLRQIHESVAVDDPLREHCGFNLLRHRNQFSVIEVEAPPHQYFPGLCLEVDEQSDLDTLQEIDAYFSEQNIPDYRLDDLIALSEREPDLFKSNRHVHRRWKEVRGNYGGESDC
jgi:spore coat polysaccharide biosynthesis protein SpsF